MDGIDHLHKVPVTGRLHDLVSHFAAGPSKQDHLQSDNLWIANFLHLLGAVVDQFEEGPEADPRVALKHSCHLLPLHAEHSTPCMLNG
jgi:hypothetical protein